MSSLDAPSFSQVGMLLLVEMECNHWMIPIVEINVHPGIPLVESGNQGLLLVESGEQGPIYPSEPVFLPLVDRYLWKVLHV